MNKSRLPTEEKAVYLKKAIKRLKIKLDREHVLAMELAPADTAEICKSMRIPIRFPDLKRCRSRITIPQFYEVAAIAATKPTYQDVASCFGYSMDRREVIRSLKIPITVEEFTACPLTEVSDFPKYVGLLDRTPTLEEIFSFYGRGTAVYQMGFMLETCKAFGYSLQFHDILPTLPPFQHPGMLYDDLFRHGITIPTEYMLVRWFPIDLFVRQLWVRACPQVFAMVPDPLYGPVGRAKLFKAKRSIRIIQRFARFCVRTNAAKRIQRAWRKCVSDPSHRVARRRLMREFQNIVPSR